MLRWLVGFDVPLWWAIIVLWVCGSERLLCGRCGLQFCVVIGVRYFYAVEIPVLCGDQRIFGREPRVLMSVLCSVCF